MAVVLAEYHSSIAVPISSIGTVFEVPQVGWNRKAAQRGVGAENPCGHLGVNRADVQGQNFGQAPRTLELRAKRHVDIKSALKIPNLGPHLEHLYVGVLFLERRRGPHKQLELCWGPVILYVGISLCALFAS